METEALQQAIGVSFGDTALLRQALVHSSYVNEHPEETRGSNQRLEFLGDACLSLVVARELYRRYPHLDEGALTEVRSRLVCDDMLAALSRRLHLGDCLLLGHGEEASGGRERDSNLADALEALVGAVLLDRGYRVAQSFVLRILRDALGAHAPGVDLRDPKSVLQELAHARGLPSPVYRLVSVDGPAHRPVYTVEAIWDDQVKGVGRGGRKIAAEREAASRALDDVR